MGSIPHPGGSDSFLVEGLLLLGLVATLLILPACGEGGGSGGGGGPTEPPVDGMAAQIEAIAGVEIGLCQGADCSYSQDYQNLGTGCANNVRGRVRAFQDDTLLETTDWWLATSTVIRVAEVFTVEDCCISSTSAQAATHYTGEAFWNNVSCN